MLDWDGFRYFLAVAEAGSLAKAARRLNVSQPTIGRKIAELEQQLEARLFQRSRRGYRLTPNGELALAEAKHLARQVGNIERALQGSGGQVAGPVSIAVSDGIGIFWLAPKMEKLIARHPLLSPEMRVGIGALDLMRGEAEIALRMGKPGSGDLVGRRLGQVHFNLYASEEYLAREGEPARLRDLASHRIIESTGRLENLDQVRRLREVARGATVAFSSDNFIVQLSAAQAGVGILPLPPYVVAGSPGLRRILAAKFDVTVELWLLTHPDLRKTPAVRALLDFILQEAKADSLSFRGKMVPRGGIEPPAP